MRALGQWSIRNNVAINLIMVFIMVAGALKVLKMRREMFPQFSLDMIYISVVYPGSAPAEVEEGICIKIEEKIEGIDGITRCTGNTGNNHTLLPHDGIYHGRFADIRPANNGHQRGISR